MGKRREEHEEHENHERWLVTYADMVTLLMVLFIVMFAMSQVDEKKFNALKAGLAAGFGSSTSVMVGSENILDYPGTSPTEPIVSDDYMNTLPPAEQAAFKKALAQQDALKLQRQYAEAQAEAERLVGVLGEVRKALEAKGISSDVKASIDARGLVLSLVSRHVTFEPNLATLSARGREVVDTVAPVLAELDDPISIDGHTNQVPVKPKYYDTDWDLAAARAITVLRHLTEISGLPGERMIATSFGSEKPLVDPDKPGSQAVNKRVDIVVLSALPSEIRDLLEEVIIQRGKGDPKVKEAQPVEPAPDPPATEGETDDHGTDHGTDHADEPATDGADDTHDSTHADAGHDEPGHDDEGGA